MTYIRIGTSTRGPNVMERRDNPSNWRSRVRGSVPRRPREDAISWTFLLSRAAVRPSIGMTDFGARIASWSFEDTIDSFFARTASLFLTSSAAPFSGSRTFFFFSTTAFFNQRARPLSSPRPSLSESEESESESLASQSTSLSSSSSSESLSESLSEELDEELLELLLLLELELLELLLLLSESLSLPSPPPSKSTFSSSSSSSGFLR
mmetsp:Transcript_26362/g.61937  ORF Transcript_26362/g.61937 Transcript_26362/m.61937 type:complete len:208 (+) Transcript_26362:1938-2561(+)